MPDRVHRYGKGYAEWVGRGDKGCWFARISIPGENRRHRLKLSTPDGRELTDKDGDERLARRLTEDLSREIRARASEQHQEAQLRRRLTVEQFGEMWTSGELFERHGEVRGLKVKRSARDDMYRLRAHVYPYIGKLAVCDVTEQDIERALAKATQAAERKLGRPWRQASKFQVYQIARRLFELAIKPGRLRADNPVSSDLRPRKDSAKLFGFLYPSEFAALMRCAAVPLARRIHYALAVYTGLRKGSLQALRWESVDFVHGTLTSLESKTNLPQIFALTDPSLPGMKSLVTALHLWYQASGEPEQSTPILAPTHVRRGREAELLRGDLLVAGVKREALFSTERNIEPLRFHDMRATFVTWARRAGKGRGWITDRTGHLSDDMMRRYDRGARVLADLNYTPFPALSTVLPELAGGPTVQSKPESNQPTGGLPVSS